MVGYCAPCTAPTLLATAPTASRIAFVRLCGPVEKGAGAGRQGAGTGRQGEEGSDEAAAGRCEQGCPCYQGKGAGGEAEA